MRRLWKAYACAAILAIAAPAFGDQKPPTPFANVTRAAWYSIKERLLLAAGKMPQEHYTFRPTDKVRTFAQILGHVVTDRYAACSPVIGRKPPQLKLDDIESKDDYLKLLRDSAAVCDMAFGLLNDETAGFRYRAFDGEYTRAALLLSTLTHDSEHYGNVVTYLRLKNIPPQ